MTAPYDVAIIGGGPGGSTLGCLLRKYNPDLRVLIVEREVFPRDHIGESQLPPISAVLEEMGCWDKVEAANFPVKIGATYTWGSTTTPWDFEFLPISDVKENEPRPSKYQGWRVQTAFQVDRAVYDKILLDHAEELGCEVRQGVRVTKVLREGDRVTGLELSEGGRVEAKRYVDASGNVGILRKAMDVKVDAPTLLQNVAFWDQWENPAWVNEQPMGATRVHIRSLPYGWIWFIPLSPTRTSIGLVTPATHYKQSGKRPAEMYAEALKEEKFIAALLQGGASLNKFETTTDWSYVVDRTCGENWFLVGEVAGFADPILSAGMTLTQTGARELAYTILELDRGEHDRDWLLMRYDELQRRRVVQHMKFAEFWYSANGQFERIRENCSAIAEQAGLKLNPAQAFAWLSRGGLGDDVPGQVGIGGLDVAGVKQVMVRLTGDQASWQINGKNVFKLNLAGATKTHTGRLENGRIIKAECYRRGDRKLELLGMNKAVVNALMQHSDADKLIEHLRTEFSATMQPEHVQVALHHAMQALEVMANDYWVHCSVKKKKPLLNVATPEEGALIHTHDPSGKVSRREASTTV